MKKLLLSFALLSNVTVFGQYGLQVIVKHVPAVYDSIYCIVNTEPVSGECTYALEKKEINGSQIVINASFDSNHKCIDNGIHDSIFVGSFPEGKYTLTFTLTDKNSLLGDNINIVPFEVIYGPNITTSANQKATATEAVLYQNTPNPFSAETELKYNVPENAENAAINVYSLNGNMLLSRPITQTGNGSITISGNELEAGTYIYSLSVNGQEVDSKRMILVK